MDEEFFDCLNKCPAQWFMQEANDDFRSYKFIDNEEEDEEDE